MVDITVTPANVRWVSGTAPRKAVAGAQIDPGELVYKDLTTLEHLLADADTDAASEVDGLAISNGEDGREMWIAPAGARCNFGATLTAGTVYALSATAGGIAPEADLATGDYIVVVCIGEGTALANLILAKGPVVHA